MALFIGAALVDLDAIADHIALDYPMRPVPWFSACSTASKRNG